MNELFSLQGRIALVTGGSRGIGRMIAAGFIAQGATVYISARKAAPCEATAAALSANGGRCIALPADVSTVLYKMDFDASSKNKDRIIAEWKQKIER